MSRKRTGHALTAVLLLVALLGQGTWALAGTTGGLSGTVTDASTGAPVADALVTVSSPSETATRTTDAGGHYVFLALGPDTYTVTASKKDFDSATQTGVTVFADNYSNLDLHMRPAVKTIANITSKSSGSLVKSGVTQDTYSINASAAAKAAALGGGGNLDNAYSAIASVPGVDVPTGGSGWNNNSVFIRGAQSFFTGYEYDGVPVNRAFDNYNSSTESTLGLQELQVYTGGGPASNSSAGTSGFINQVIKTGTYPGTADLAGGLGSPAFYHEARFEVGGASPNRNFSYYVGLSGYNQDYRYVDNNNGTSYMNPLGGPLEYWSTAPDNPTYDGGWGSQAYGQGVVPLCNLGVNDSVGIGLLPAAVDSLPNVQSGGDKPGCLYPQFGLIGFTSSIMDRENVVNLHFGIPRKDGLRDDIQLLWSASALQTAYYSGNVNDNGFGPVGLTIAETGFAYCPPTGVYNGQACSPNYPSYTDNPAIYFSPFGSNVDNAVAGIYRQQSSPQDRAAGSTLPNNYRDPIWNDTGILKAQYTHSLSENAYLRLFGYTFFSDWTQAGAADSYDLYFNGIGGAGSGVADNYDLITHTAGGELQFADQLNDQNLLQFTANYTKANVSRYYNVTTAYGQFADPVGLISQDSGGAYHCYSPQNGSEIGCGQVATVNFANIVGGTLVTPGECVTGTYTAITGISCNGSLPAVPVGSPVQNWSQLWNGGQNGSYNTVAPRFAFLALSDQWRPSDKLLVDLSARYENYTYGLPDSVTPADTFYAQIFQNYACVNGNNIATQPLGPGVPPPAPVLYTGGTPGNAQSCGTLGSQYANYVHPDCAGSDPCFSVASPSSYSLPFWSPRVSATYTQSPDTVWRFSGGRFTQPPISASVQYLNYSGDQRSVWASAWQLGLRSPFHPIPAMSAANYDMSLERHIRGTDWSFKFSPFYSFITGYQEQSFIGQNFVTQVPVGNFRSTGMEVALSKGNFNENGLSGTLSLTYTKAQVQYTNYFGQNQLTVLQQAINEYDKLTQAGGGSQCYTEASLTNGAGTPTACAAGTIFNPYYSQPSINPNSVLNKTWYPATSYVIYPGLNSYAGFYDAPWITSMLLNYRHDKWAITPSFQIQSGSSYGNPLNVIGVDPRDCAANQLQTGVADATAQAGGSALCDYLQALGQGDTAFGTLYVPDPNIGTFDTMGQYKNPNIFIVNLQASYDLSPRVTAQLTLADLFHSCFGGTSTPWSKIWTPGNVYCGYASNQGYFVSNMYNGNGPNDTVANGITPQPWQTQPYAPRLNNGLSQYFPFNAYVNVQIKL